MMKMIIGKDMFPLVHLDGSRYTQLMPVTRYQFERYIWETAPEFDYKVNIDGNPRISTKDLNKDNVSQMFISDLSSEQALGYAKWMEGRLPVKKEASAIESLVESISPLLLLKIIRKKKYSIRSIDIRFIHLLEKINRDYNSFIYLHGGKQELYSNLATLPDQSLFLHSYANGCFIRLAGDISDRGTFLYRIIIDLNKQRR